MWLTQITNILIPGMDQPIQLFLIQLLIVLQTLKFHVIQDGMQLQQQRTIVFQQEL